MPGEFSEEAAWSAAQRIEAWAGEVRVNLIRLVAIAGLFGHHLINRYLLKLDMPADYHRAVTGIAVGWTLAALALHSALSRRWNPPGLRYAAVAFDAMMIASVLLVSDGPRGPFFMLLFLLVATAGLRLDLRLVWTAAALAILAYLLACGHDRWVRQLAEHDRVPRQHQVIVVIGLACAGLLAGQAVRQTRRFARDLADRMKPEETV
ncbi:MAG TPA: hypothetical protein VEN81_00790 [Planctomycetota bacterium]|nr:hypothetical protein [Planctomycetota bacterium]